MSKKGSEKLFRIRRMNCLLGRVICCNCKCNYRQGCSFYCLLRSSWTYIKGLLIIEQYPPFSFDSVIWLVQVCPLSAGCRGKIKFESSVFYSAKSRLYLLCVIPTYTVIMVFFKWISTFHNLRLKNLLRLLNTFYCPKHFAYQILFRCLCTKST